MRPLLIVNPRAAGSRAGKRFAETAAAVRETLGLFDAVFTERAGHGEALGRAAAEEGRDLVVAVGGDGTFSEVVNGVLSADRTTEQTRPAPPATRVGLIVRGTGGDYRRTLGMSGSLDEYVKALASGRERLVDVGRMRYADQAGHERERYFVNIVSAGMGGLVDHYVVQAPSIMGGRLAYYAATLRALARVPLASLVCRTTLDGVEETRRLQSRMIAVCNGKYFGSGMQVAPDATLDDGRLEVVSIGTRTRAELVLRSPTVYRGTHLAIPAVTHFACQRIRIESADGSLDPASFPLDVDGDPRGRLPLQVDVLPRCLRLRG